MDNGNDILLFMRQLYYHNSRRPSASASARNSFKTDLWTTKEAEIGNGTFIQPSQANQLTSQPPASLPEMPWLAIIFLFWSYLSHFQSDFDCVKSLFNLYNQSSYLASHRLVSKLYLNHFKQDFSGKQVRGSYIDAQSKCM